jgi:hypothetical protein
MEVREQAEEKQSFRASAASLPEHSSALAMFLL